MTENEKKRTTLKGVYKYTIFTPDLKIKQLIPVPVQAVDLRNCI